MNPIDTLASMPQFVPTDTPGVLLNVLSGCYISARKENPGIVVKSAGGMTALEGKNLEQYLQAADMQATLLVSGRR